MAAPYVGNADFRGYLNYLAKNGDSGAATALNYTGNDGGVNRGALNEYWQAAPGANVTDEQQQQTGLSAEQKYYAAYNALNAPSNPGGGSAGTAQDQADEAAYWQDQMNAADQNIGRLDQQGAAGRANILGSYNSAFGTLQGQKATDERNYNTNKQNTIDDNVQARNAVDTNVRTTNNNTQRFLQAHGAGSSSAAQILAPYAAALQGSTQRQGVQNAFGKNLQSLDTNWGDTVQKYDDSFGDLLNQKTNQERQLDSGLATSRATALQAKGDAAVAQQQARGASYQTARAARVPYQSQIQSLLSQIDSLGQNVNFTPHQVAYQAPTLDKYDPGQAAAPVASDSPVGAGALGNLGAYYTLLQGKDKKQPVLA